MKYKCKPTFNFQSIEFEWDTEQDGSYEEMIAHYNRVVDDLEKTVTKKQEEKSPLATEAQKKIMKENGIKFSDKTTKDEAHRLIDASIAKAKREKSK